MKKGFVSLGLAAVLALSIMVLVVLMQPERNALAQTQYHVVTRFDDANRGISVEFRGLTDSSITRYRYNIVVSYGCGATSGFQRPPTSGSSFRINVIVTNSCSGGNLIVTSTLHSANPLENRRFLVSSEASTTGFPGWITNTPAPEPAETPTSTVTPTPTATLIPTSTSVPAGQTPTATRKSPSQDTATPTATATDESMLDVTEEPIETPTPTPTPTATATATPTPSDSSNIEFPNVPELPEEPTPTPVVSIPPESPSLPSAPEEEKVMVEEEVVVARIRPIAWTHNCLIKHAATPVQLCPVGDGSGWWLHYNGGDGTISGPYIPDEDVLIEMGVSEQAQLLAYEFNPFSGKAVQIIWLPDIRVIRVNTYYADSPYDTDKPYVFDVAGETVIHSEW